MLDLESCSAVGDRFCTSNNHQISTVLDVPRSTNQVKELVCREGVCVNTTLNHAHLALPHTFFSRVTQDFSHRVNRNLCVSQNSHSSHPAQHVARALIVVSFTLEHHFTFRMHSSPTSYPTIYPTFVAVHFTWRYTLRGSIECVFRPPG